MTPIFSDPEADGYEANPGDDEPDVQGHGVRKETPEPPHEEPVGEAD